MNTRQRRTPDPLVPIPRIAEERVILVDADGREVGSEEKMRAHELGVLHRAVSVFLFDGQGRLLLQRRASGKYHSPGLWSNTCCGHPRPGESSAQAASRRLGEEMGVECSLRPAFAFTYRADLGGGLIEHELDDVFTGRFSGAPSPNPEEVDAWGWMHLPTLAEDCATNPGRYSAWLPLALRQVIDRALTG